MEVNPSFGFIAPLFVPASRPERFAKAAASGADAVILDLEDAVPPDEKISARAALTTDFTDLPVFVRVNAQGSLWHLGDLEAVGRLGAAGIVLPKARRDAFAAVPETLPVIALIETAEGLAQAREIASRPGVVRLAFGSLDYAADLGCAHIRAALLVARNELVIASRLASHLPPVDGVTEAIDDDDRVTDDARYARNLGFGGKLCIHPRQIAPTRLGFMPTVAEVAWARRVATAGDGAVSVDGTMVDGPVRLRALALLARTARSSSEEEGS